MARSRPRGSSTGGLPRVDIVLVIIEGGGTIGSDGTNDDGGGRRIRMTMVAGLGSPGFYFYFYFFSPNLFLYAAGIGNRVKKNGILACGWPHEKNIFSQTFWLVGMAVCKDRF